MTNFLADYEPVEDRIRAFWEEHADGRIVTELVSAADGNYIVRAEVYRLPPVTGASMTGGVQLPDATGYAQESVTQRGVNSTSALENCETSAIGRALANLGYAAKGKRPSREEMSKTEPPVGTVVSAAPAGSSSAAEAHIGEESGTTTSTAAESSGVSAEGEAAGASGGSPEEVEATGKGASASSVELWIEARELIGNTGQVVRYAAKLLGKTVSSSTLTPEDLAAVIAAKRGEAA